VDDSNVPPPRRPYRRHLSYNDPELAEMERDAQAKLAIYEAVDAGLCPPPRLDRSVVAARTRCN
jgi:hypothetical protein